MIALYFISISPLLWWGLARALCSSTYRGLKVGQDDREREAPLMRSTAGFWPPKIYWRQVLLKKSHHEREKLHSFIPQVCVFFQPCMLLLLNWLFFYTLNFSMCTSPVTWISQLWCGTLSLPEVQVLLYPLIGKIKTTEKIPLFPVNIFVQSVNRAVW